MFKSRLSKILVTLWAVALVAVGIFMYRKNNESCLTCQTKSTIFDTLTEAQKDKLNHHEAGLIALDSGDLIFVDEATAFSRSDMTAFSIAQAPNLTEEEINSHRLSLRFNKFRMHMPPDLQKLYRERKLAIIQSTDGNFFIVALSDYVK
jgi:hypothetical protein